MISNPVTGNKLSTGEEIKFTYVNQRPEAIKAWNFQPHDCGLSNHMEANLLFFASDQHLALRRLKEMLEWYVNNNSETMRSYTDAWTRPNWRRAKVQSWLDNWEKVKVVEVPMNQFFKVGWAANDTIL
ncbi:hypothetical protein EAb13_CDS0021 [Acinetobacter phage EAb13]|nr:hypothetical protein EAb13_CDS0021 [Acinetobacter phage EAb13]